MAAPKERPKEQGQRRAGSQHTVPPAVTCSCPIPPTGVPSQPPNSSLIAPMQARPQKATGFLCNILVCSSDPSPCGTDTELLDEPLFVHGLQHITGFDTTCRYCSPRKEGKQTPAPKYDKKQFLSVLCHKKQFLSVPCLPPQLKTLVLCNFLEH